MEIYPDFVFDQAENYFECVWTNHIKLELTGSEEDGWMISLIDLNRSDWICLSFYNREKDHLSTHIFSPINLPGKIWKPDRFDQGLIKKEIIKNSIVNSKETKQVKEFLKKELPFPVWEEIVDHVFIEKEARPNRKKLYILLILLIGSIWLFY